MPFISITRLRLASWWHLPQLTFHSLRSIMQARRARGFLVGWTSRDAENGYWTATVWQSAEAMMAFRNSGAHSKAMPKLLHMCDQAAYTHFEQDSADVPDVDAAYEILRSQGKMSKVNAPSPAQLAGERVGRTKPYSPQRWSPRQD